MSTTTARGVPMFARGILADRHAVLFALTWGIGDTVSTLMAAGAVGAGLEANPVVRFALHTSPLAVIALKALAVGVTLALWARGGEYIRSVPGWWLWAYSVHALGVFVTVTNIAVWALNV